jgi:hypothetical protein
MATPFRVSHILLMAPSRRTVGSPGRAAGIDPAAVNRDKKLLIEEEEAERVRMIFQRYLELGSIGLLLADLRVRGIVTKIRHLSCRRTAASPSPEARSPKCARHDRHPET